MSANGYVYKDSLGKVVDFFLGIFLNICIGIVYFCLSLLSYGISSIVNNSSLQIITIILIIVLVCVEWGFFRYFFKGRRYIAIGMLACILVPLLLFGLCVAAVPFVVGCFCLGGN